jgi:hypothetical protein
MESTSKFSQFVHSWKAKLGMPITILTLVLRYGRQLLDLIGEGQTASDMWKVISAKPWVPILLKYLDPIVLTVGIGLIIWAHYCPVKG